MSSTYKPCSYFNEPIITSHGVIFGLETNGNFVTGNLPHAIQAAYIRNNQVPYMPFTNINHNSPSYVTNNQRQDAYERITKYNLPAITAESSKVALTFNTYNTPTPTITREQELELERTIMEKTNLDPMSCKTYVEYSETTKQIKELVKSSISKGLDNAIAEYKSSTQYENHEYATIPEKITKPEYMNEPVTNSFSSIRDRLNLIQRSDIYGSIGSSSDTDSIGSSMSDSDSDMSELTTDIDDTHITDVGCVLIYIDAHGKKTYIMGMNSSNTYSIITQKVFANIDFKESSISTLTKLLNTHFPSVNIAVNNTTHFNDKKVSGKNYRIYQIYVNAFDMNNNNKQINALKLAGLNITFNNFKLIPTDNVTVPKLNKRELIANDGKTIKIDYVTKNIFID